MVLDDFLCERQIDEIIPEEYEDWLKWMYGNDEDKE